MRPRGPWEHLNLAFFSSLAGDFQTGEREARTAWGSVPGEWRSSILVKRNWDQGKLSEASDTYHGLEKFGPEAHLWPQSALADLAMYQGHFSEQMKLLEQGANADLKAKTPESATNKFAALAYAQLLRGDSKAAVASAEKALANGQTLSRFGAVPRPILGGGAIAREGRQMLTS